MIKGSVQEEVITLIDVYAPNTEAPKYKSKHWHIKEVTDSSTVILGNFNIPPALDHSDRTSVRQQ